MDIRLYIKLNIYYLKKGRHRQTEKDRKHVCTHQEKERKEAKMATRGQKSLGVGVACPLKGPETKRNNKWDVFIKTLP